MRLGLFVQPRSRVSWRRESVASALSVAAALLAGMPVLWLAGLPPLAAYEELFGEAFGTAFGLSETLIKATPLIFTGLAAMIVFRMSFWSIGGEGQLYLGACAATAAAAWPLPIELSWVRLSVMLAAGALAGSLWGALPAALRSARGINETLSSLLLNYVAIAIAGYLVYGPWRDVDAGNFPLSPLLPESAQLPRVGGLRLHAGLGLALAAAAVFYVVQQRSRLGFALRVIGDNRTAARYAGVHLPVTTIVVAGLGGAAAGVAGMVEVAGIQHRLIAAISPGYGYTGIIVAVLGRFHPVGVILAGILLGGLFTGGEVLQASRQVPVSVVFIFHGFLLFAVLVAGLVSGYRLRLYRVAR